MQRERIAAFFFIAPAAILIGCFILWPAVQMVISSFYDLGLTQRPSAEFCGADNYRFLVQYDTFAKSVCNTFYFTILVVPLQTGLALLLAAWFNRPQKGMRFFRMAVFVPTAISLTVLSVLWDLIYAPASATGSGLFNGFLQALRLPPQPFLTSPHQAMNAIVAMSIWQGVGFQMMIFLAGLQNIPAQRYEAASIDGANSIQKFVHVTMPGIAPTAMFVLLITTIFALKLFVQPYLMTQGGPQGSTISIVQYIYEAAFFGRDLGLACAAGTLFFMSLCVIAGMQRWMSRRVEEVS